MSTEEPTGGGVPTEEPTIAADEGCGESYPKRRSLQAEYTGYVIICDDGSGANAQKISIENISDTLVISATPLNQTWTTSNVTPAPEPRFAQAQIQLRVPPGCDQRACTLPPGTTLTVAANEPVRVNLQTRREASLAAAAAYTGLNRLNAKLGTPSQRLMDQAAECYRVAAGIRIDSDRPYEEQFRDLLGLEGCRSLYQGIAQESAQPPPEQPAAVKGLANRAQKLLGASFNDVMVFVLKVTPH